MSPYRDSALRCPHCGGGLRDHESRLVCDACDGMLLPLDDLATSIHEIDGGDAPVELRDRAPLAAACPRCGGNLETGTIAIGSAVLGTDLVCCPVDGVWMPRDTLVAAYANAGRRKHRLWQSFGTSADGSVALTGAPSGGRAGPPAGVGMVAVIQADSNPFAHADLAISQWQRPRVHTVFVTAYRGRKLTCSTCGGAPLAFEGDRWVCATCHGSFVEDAALIAMVEEMSGTPWQLPAPEGAAGARTCPVCAAPMRTEAIEAVTIDRCHGHGVWFAPSALAGMLEHAAQPAKVGGWLHRLFHRGS